MDGRPVRFDLTAVTLLGAGFGVQLGFECRIGHVLGQGPAQARNLEAVDRFSDCRRGYANSTSDLTGRYATNKLQSKHFAHLAHGRSLCWHPIPPLKPSKERT